MANKYVKSFNFGGDTLYPLPIVTAEQNGMVLKVVDGEWEAKDITYVYVAPGLYDSDGVMICSWDEWTGTYGMDISKYNGDTYMTDPKSPYNVFANNPNLLAGSKLVIHEDVTVIGDSAFRKIADLALIELLGKITRIEPYAFLGCKNLLLSTIPDTVWLISNQAFSVCKSLESFEFPASVNIINDLAFSGCTNLKTVTYRGTPGTIANNVFYGCTNLTTINVPWSEGEVANAPWGATNATINYNYVG